MSSENRQKTLAALNDLWQGNPIRRTRQGEGAYTLYGRRLAVHLMVQPGVARDFMADPMAGGYRLPAALPDLRARRAPSDAAPGDGAAGQRRRSTASPAGCALFSKRRFHQNPRSRELSPRTLATQRGRPGAAGSLSRTPSRPSKRPERSLAHVTGYASKAAEQAARIAGVLTLWRDLNAAEVAASDMANAITLAQFYLGEAARLADAADYLGADRAGRDAAEMASGELGRAGNPGA